MICSVSACTSFSASGTGDLKRTDPRKVQFAILLRSHTSVKETPKTTQKLGENVKMCALNLLRL